MIVKDKEKFYKRLFIYRYLKFLNFESDIKDEELQTIIRGLNIKSRYKRIKFVIEESCNYIDNYYKGCNLCHFKNNKCICHRKKNKDYINGCCRTCKYQSNKGCTTKNVACKLFNCSYVDLNGKKKLTVKDVKILYLLNFYQRYVISTDFFVTPKTVARDLYVGPMMLLLLLILRIILWVIV